MNTVALGTLIRRKRREKGLTQKDFAALLHVSSAAANKWENGKNLPDVQNLLAISALLEIPVAELLEGCPPPVTESDTNDIASKQDSQSSSPPEDSHLPEPPLPETPAPQPEDIPEPSHTAIPDRADTVSIEIPDTPPPQPEKFSVSPPSERKRLRWKTAVLLTLLLAGITAFCWMAGGMKSKSPSFTVRDAYYGDYDGENAYYVIAEFASEPTNDDFYNFNEKIRGKYEEHFSAVNRIVVIYAQNYTDYMKNGYNDKTDYMGIIFPLSPN